MTTLREWMIRFWATLRSRRGGRGHGLVPRADTGAGQPGIDAAPIDACLGHARTGHAAGIATNGAAILPVDNLHPEDVECLHREPDMKARYQTRIELLQGTLDLLVLQTLQWGPRHGYGITQAIRANSGDVLQVETGSLYPALHRLERQGLIAAAWKTSESNQRVREYRLTPRGKRELASSRSRWEQLQAAIAGVLNPAKPRA